MIAGVPGDDPAPPRRSFPLRGTALALAVTAATLLLGYLLKQPCASGDWADGRQYRRLCYSDIVPLYGTEKLNEGKVPYLSADNEYPVGTGIAMWAAAQPARALAARPENAYAPFFHANVVVLGACALGVAAILWRLVGRRALFFAAAPTLLVYGFMNWDLLAVLLATAGTAAFLPGADLRAGAWLGLGMATKLYPGLLVVPFAAHRARARRFAGAAAVAGAAAAAWAIVNLPFAAADAHRWSNFFRFNADRPADWDSLWFLWDRHVRPLSTGAINLLSPVTFVGAAAVVWYLKARREPDFPAWSFGFPLLVAFLLTNKVYSPQYGVWLLPWFALAIPRLGYFAAFEAADVAVFVTRFRFFGDPLGESGAWFDAFQVFVVVRAVVLVACVAWWIRHRSDREAERGAVPGPALADAS